MSRHFATVLLLSALTLPALAGESLSGDGASQCPERKSATGVARVAAQAKGDPAEDAARAESRSGGEAAAAPQRIRPRWQSYLPGMIR